MKRRPTFRAACVLPLQILGVRCRDDEDASGLEQSCAFIEDRIKHRIVQMLDDLERVDDVEGLGGAKVSDIWKWRASLERVEPPSTHLLQ